VETAVTLIRAQKAPTPTLPRKQGRVGVGASAVLLAALVSGCGSLSAPVADGPRAEPARPSRPTTKPGQKPPPIATRALNVSSDCTFRDPTGYRGEMKLKVADAEVQAFEARVDIPEQGVCRFALADFRQTETLPNVVLRARGSSCTVRMWEQGRRVTVAFNDCADRCTGGAYPYLWPILASRSGSCG
jgi:hypothetical protein